jgi:hypothetical protein
MKQYFLKAKDAAPESPLRADNLRDAVSEITWNYANCGKVELLVKEYSLKRTKVIPIDTDYS